MMHVGLFTHNFLEPTHHAIAQMIRAQGNVEYTVFAKRFTDQLYFNLPNVRGRFAYQNGFVSNLRSYGIDLVHAIYDGNTAINAAMNAFEAELPFFLSFHGGYDTNSKIFLPKYAFKTREIVQLADVVSVPSFHDVRQINSLGVTRSLDVLPVPIDTRLLDPRDYTQVGMILCVGRLIPKKGIDLAIQMLVHLPDQYHLVVVGEGELKESLQDLAEELGVSKRVAWKGLLPLVDTLKELGTAEFLVHPARTAPDGNAEGTPQIILWAQALGIPVIATKTGGIAELIETKVSGMLVQPENPVVLAETISRLASDQALKNKVVDCAKERVLSRHALVDCSSQLENLYEKTLNGSSAVVSASKFVPKGASLRVAAPYPLRKYIQKGLLRFLGNGLPHPQLELFATGGQSLLFKLTDSNNKTVVLKIPDFNSFPEEAYGLLRHNLQKEVLALATLGRLEIEEVPRLYHHDEAGNFLIREYMNGPVLSEMDFTEQGGCSVESKLTILNTLLRLAKVLFDAFHNSQPKAYVIRDFKPRNLVWCPSTNELKFIDVGATKSEDDMVIKSSSKVRIGTGNWLFWAPEQLLNEGASMNRKVDYFALGCTAHYILMGKEPYTNSEQDRAKLMERYFKEFETVRPSFVKRCEAHLISPNLTEFLANCLHPLAADRPSNFCNVLDRVF